MAIRNPKRRPAAISLDFTLGVLPTWNTWSSAFVSLLRLEAWRCYYPQIRHVRVDLLCSLLTDVHSYHSAAHDTELVAVCLSSQPLVTSLLRPDYLTAQLKSSLADSLLFSDFLLH